MVAPRAMSLIVTAFLGAAADAFTTSTQQASLTRSFSSTQLRVDVQGQGSGIESDIEAIRRKIRERSGVADTEFAKKYGHLVGAKVKTVAESFAEFTNELEYSVNPLYKNMVTDLVGTTHLIVVNARFERDAVWSLGILTSLDMLLRNYPEKDVAERIVTALFNSMGLDESKIRAEAKKMEEWASSATREDVEKALEGEGDSELAKIANKIKGNKWWMYSRYFGVGLVKIMERVGIDVDKDEAYPIMQDWMGNKLGRSSLTACNDSDLYFKVREKLEMMETMMKEVEIREKKRMAERLEEKAENALRAADKEKQMQAEIEAEAKKSRDRVASGSKK